jgi:NADPH:quinone reductase-like Zn-dependent oxidoreductase
VDGRNAPAGTIERIADLITQGSITVPIAATYPLEQIQDAVSFASARHVHGKVVITL